MVVLLTKEWRILLNIVHVQRHIENFEDNNELNHCNKQHRPMDNIRNLLLIIDNMFHHRDRTNHQDKQLHLSMIKTLFFYIFHVDHHIDDFPDNNVNDRYNTLHWELDNTRIFPMTIDNKYFHQDNLFHLDREDRSISNGNL